ncbi:hypothetical protein FPANT_2393 [Fusarium pseudoanthophilum]|uniref:Uncharacterized protein n=1 Tax=Fusarium pseudoanthophilum TaxID=48495 RepID=A0A8H5UV56_9HYPO|nr:hypothetical protein FPANT_2393 [Fusarium pseudoanthophilum]
MSITAAVATALDQYEFDEETGFDRQADAELPCLHCVLSAHRDGRETPPRCTLYKRDQKTYTAVYPSTAEAMRVTQAYWNALDSEFSTDRPLTRFEKWRVMQNLLPTGSFLPEIHDNATIEENLRRTVTAYARECREANTFVVVLERLPTAFETPFDGENDRKKAKLPPMELPDDLIEGMERLIAGAVGTISKETSCNVVRTIGQGRIRRGAAQATPQKRRRALKADNDDLEESSIQHSEALELMARPRAAIRKLSWLVWAFRFFKASQGLQCTVASPKLVRSVQSDARRWPVVTVKANDRGGVLVISEPERNNGQSIAGTEAIMSKLACLRPSPHGQSQSLSSLRRPFTEREQRAPNPKDGQIPFADIDFFSTVLFFKASLDYRILPDFSPSKTAILHLSRQMPGTNSTSMHWRRVADLRDTTKVRGVHPPLDTKYKIVYKEYRSVVKPLNAEPERFLRRENVDTNGLSYCEVYSIPEWNYNYCALVKTAPRSETFIVSELERRFDYWFSANEPNEPNEPTISPFP